MEASPFWLYMIDNPYFGDQIDQGQTANQLLIDEYPASNVWQFWGDVTPHLTPLLTVLHSLWLGPFGEECADGFKFDLCNVCLQFPKEENFVRLMIEKSQSGTTTLVWATHNTFEDEIHPVIRSQRVITVVRRTLCQELVPGGGKEYVPFSAIALLKIRNNVVCIQVFPEKWQDLVENAKEHLLVSCRP